VNEGAEKVSSNKLSWVIRIKKNISLSLVVVPILKVFTHFLLFANLHKVVNR